MAVLSAILFLSLGSFMAADMQCRRKYYEKECDEGALMGPVINGFPESREDMNEACRQVKSRFSCIVNAYDACETFEGDEQSQGTINDEIPEHLQLMRSTLSFMEAKLCNPNSELHETVANNLGCLKIAIPKGIESCEEHDRKFISALEDLVLEKAPAFGPNDYQNDCLTAVTKATCLAISLSDQCGDAVGDAFLETAINVGDKFQKCPRALLDQVPDIVKDLRQVTQEVESKIRKRR